ncbi:hypothetical protein [Azospirillum lipoferum]|uniref:Helix-turn-helix domain-containing protein n=1 Tax=Azospirillum lipoferum (strain 4B) TaxID=862719 RepID=G7Z5G1_AZOL4|nr:hypothetical protein [Azospirillum lipoferum]CBS87017.1 conserved protein of unknown function [Azospirillum lipoferum 4B]
MKARVVPAAQLAPPTLADDILQGADSIAKFMGVTRRQAYHFVADGRIPTFRIGAIICARKSTILNWIADQERHATSSAIG